MKDIAWRLGRVLEFFMRWKVVCVNDLKRWAERQEDQSSKPESPNAPKSESPKAGKPWSPESPKARKPESPKARKSQDWSPKFDKDNVTLYFWYYLLAIDLVEWLPQRQDNCDSEGKMPKYIQADPIYRYSVMHIACFPLPFCPGLHQISPLPMQRAPW